MKLSARIVVIACFVAAAGNAPVRAQTPIQPGSVLTLKRAIQIALQYHPRRMESQSEMSAANARIGIARSDLLPQVYSNAQYLRGTANGIGNALYFNEGYLPRLSGVNHDLPTGDFSQSFSSGDSYGGGLSISQFLFDFGRVSGFIDQRRAEYDQSRAELQLTDLNLIFNVAQQYFGLLAAKQLVQVYEQAIVQRQEHLHQAQVMAQADLRPMLDVSVTQADLSRAQLHLVQAQNAVDDAKVALDYAMGLAGQATAYEPEEILSYQPITASFESLLRNADEMRPDLKALIDGARAAGAMIKQARSDYLPTGHAAAGYVALGTGTPMANNYFAGLVIDWPLFNGFRTEEQVSEARYRQRAIGHAVDDLRQRVIQEVHTTFLNWQASISVIDRARKTLDASREEFRLADERYRQGLSSIVELDDAQRRFTQDSAAYVSALYGYALAKAAVDRATGQSLQGI